jgi:ESF2/ABP1 family protein
MTTRKHNEFLDLPSEDEEQSDRGYDSEENVTKSKAHNVKRRRTADTQDLFGLQSDQSDEEDSENDAPEEKGKARKQAKSRKEAASDEEVEEEGAENSEDGEEEDDYLDLTASKSSKSKKPLATKPVKPTKKSKSKPGVIYLSSLPPYLKPSALRSFLEQRGFEPITRVFLQPTVKGNGASKRQSNKRKTYSDGWVEFQSKATYVWQSKLPMLGFTDLRHSAKLAAETLNCQLVGGKKGSWYHDDIWNMKYRE